MSKRIRFSAVLLMLAAASLHAQETRGAILGRVLDSSGAVIPGVTMKATNTETNVTVATVSNAEGNYEIPYLVPGAYRLTAESAGFKTFVRGGIELRIGDRMSIPVSMQVGEMAEHVTDGSSKVLF